MSGRTFKTIAIAVPLFFAAWAVALVVVTLFQPAGQPVAVFAPGGPGQAIEAVAAANGYILQVRGGTVIAIAKDSGFVRRLYGAGALLVVAANIGGCIVVPAAGERSLPPSA
jgi:hypothetical protein